MSAIWSCKSIKEISETKETKVDTIEIYKTKIDTFIKTETITLPIENIIEIPCDTTYNIIEQRLGNSKVRLEQNKGKVLFTFKSDSTSNKTTYRTKYDTIYKNRIKYAIKTNTITKEVPKRYVPFWVKVLAWIGGISVAYRIGKFIFFKYIAV